MRENNRKPIEKCIKKLPQFTTMNVIDGQAGLVIYSSLIFYSLTIDNILNIVILLILAGIVISSLTGGNGLFKRAKEAKDKTEKARLQEMIDLYIADVNVEMLNNPNYPGNGVIELENLPINFDGIKPKLGWVYLENNIVVEYEFYFDNFYILNVNGEIIVKDYDNLINVKEYGAIGDGIVDDTSAIKEAISILNTNGGILYFPVGTYLVSINSNNETTINLNTNKDIEIDFFKSTIKMSANEYPRYNIVSAENCNNVEVRNGNLIGDRLEHDYVTTSSSHCWGMGIRLKNNTNCRILNMEISNMTGDAIINENNSKGTTNIDKCDLHHCRRMGITISDSDIVNINDTNIQYIGTFDNITGVNPMSGIDIEPTSEESVINCVSINNINVKDTTSYGIINGSQYIDKVKQINITNSEIDYAYINNAGNISNSKLIYTTKRAGQFRNCVIKDTTIYKKNGGDFILDNTVVDNCIFEGDDINDNNNDISYRIFLKNATVKNSIFKNIRGTGNYSTSSTADFGICLTSGYNLTAESSNNIYEKCTMVIDGDGFSDTNSTINDSYIYTRYNDIIFNKIKFINCETKSSTAIKISFNECSINNCGTFGNSEKHLIDSYMKCDSLLSRNYFNVNSVCDNSTIEITGEIISNSFYNINFKNNSKIIIDKYLNINLNIPNSIEGTDYTVEYNETETVS